MRYANPLTGGPVMPTMGAHLALFPKGFKGKDYQSTDGTIFVCVEGEGIDQGRAARPSNGARTTCSWCRRGSSYSHTAKSESVLFSISDRPAQEALGIWREQN